MAVERSRGGIGKRASAGTARTGTEWLGENPPCWKGAGRRSVVGGLGKKGGGRKKLAQWKSVGSKGSKGVAKLRE